MNTELKMGRVRFVVSGSDQRLVHAVVNRFVEWWDASGHRDLVASNDIVPLADVTWDGNAASLTLPVNFESPIGSEPPTSFEILSFLPSEGAPRVAMAEADDRASPESVVFEIVDDESDAALMQFPSEAEPARRPTESADIRTATRPRRRRAGSIVGVSRRVAAGAAMVATSFLRILLLPWLLTARAVSSCYRLAGHAIVFTGRGALAVGTACALALWRVVMLPWSLSLTAASGCYRYMRRVLPRAGRGAVAVGTACVLALWRVVTLPWSLSLTAASGCYRYMRRVLPRAGRGAIAVGASFVVALWRVLTVSWSSTATAAIGSYRHACRGLLRLGGGLRTAAAISATLLMRVVTLPWSLVVFASKSGRDLARPLLLRVAAGPAHRVTPPLIVRAAAISAVLALVIAASIARPSLIANLATVSTTTAPVRTPPATERKVEAPLLPSRSLAMFVAPSLRPPVPVVSPVPVGTSYTRATKTTGQKREARAARTEQRQERRQPASRQRIKPTPAVVQTASVDYVGSLTIVSEPSGATVRIDGRTVGTTPLQLNDVRVGSHAVHVALDGYPAWSTAATVVYGKTNGVVARLAR